METLSAKEVLFISHYVSNNFNAKRSAIAVGYSEASAHELGSRLLKKVEVRKAIDEILQDNTLTKLELLHRLGEIARNRATDYMLNDGSLDIEAMKNDGCLWLLKSYRINPKTGKMSWQAYDGMKALEALAKVYGLVNDNPLVTVNLENHLSAEKELNEKLKEIGARLNRDYKLVKVTE